MCTDPGIPGMSGIFFKATNIGRFAFFSAKIYITDKFGAGANHPAVRSGDKYSGFTGFLHIGLICIRPSCIDQVRKTVAG